MANSGSGGPPVDTREGGLIVGSTHAGELRKLLDLPDDQAEAKFDEWLRERRRQADERSRRHLDEFLAEIKFGHVEP